VSPGASIATDGAPWNRRSRPEQAGNVGGDWGIAGAGAKFGLGLFGGEEEE
jgi:hypothetical protein